MGAGAGYRPGWYLGRDFQGYERARSARLKKRNPAHAIRAARCALAARHTRTTTRQHREAGRYHFPHYADCTEIRGKIGSVGDQSTAALRGEYRGGGCAADVAGEVKKLIIADIVGSNCNRPHKKNVRHITKIAKNLCYSSTGCILIGITIEKIFMLKSFYYV